MRGVYSGKRCPIKEEFANPAPAQLLSSPKRREIKMKRKIRIRKRSKSKRKSRIRNGSADAG
jgi:hypothetical protein